MKQPPSSFAIAVLVILSTACLTLAAVPVLRDTLYYPELVVKTGADIQMSFLGLGMADRRSCEDWLGKKTQAIANACPGCVIAKRQCADQPDQGHLEGLSTGAIGQPSARYSDGVVLYSAPQAALAELICRASEGQSRNLPAQKRLKCYPAGQERPIP